MRISTSQFYRQGVEVILDQQTQLNKTEVELATGKKVNTPSDDPSAAVSIMTLEESSSRLAQYQRNASQAQGRLEQEEVALEGMNNLLQRVRELVVQGNNASMDLENRQAIAHEVGRHLETYVQLANSRDANGEYIFAGYRTDSQPLTTDGLGNFTYNGDDGQRSLQIGDSREVVIGDPGSQIFENIPANAGGTTDIGSILYDVVANYQVGNPDDNALADLDEAIGNILDTRARVGARVKAIEDQVASNESLELSVAQVKSSLEDLDYAETISKFNQQLLSLQASQQSFLRIQGLSLFNFLG